MGDDRISELPLFIIHHILSYLSTKDVIQTSILSKRWNLLRKSFPIFDFDQTCPGKDISNTKTFGDHCERLRKFIRLVDVSLFEFCQLDFRMQKFKLRMRPHDGKELFSLIDKWIGLAVEKEVKVLDFHVQRYQEINYSLPQTIFYAESLSTLKLRHCNLVQPSYTMRFYSLKKLIISDICMNEEMVKMLTSECPLLEYLAFQRCKGLKRLCVFEASKLKITKVCFGFNEQDLESLEIAIPGLQKLTIRIFQDQRLQVFDISRCIHLRKLDLGWNHLTYQDFDYFVSKFHFLEDLYIRQGALLERVKISSNRLKSLKLFFCCKAIDVDTPNLLSFTYYGRQIPIYSINAPCPWTLSFQFDGDIDTNRYRDMKEFFCLSKQIKFLRIYVKLNKISFDLDEFKESSPSLPCKVGNLNLLIDVPSSNYEALLNGFLWICHPKILYVTTWNQTQTENKFGQWVYEEYEEFKKKQDLHCCNSRHVKCWRHHFKDIKFIRR